MLAAALPCLSSALSSSAFGAATAVLARPGRAGSWPQTSRVECVQYALVCGACVDLGCSSRLRPVGIGEIYVPMPKVDIYISILEEPNITIQYVSNNALSPSTAVCIISLSASQSPLYSCIYISSHRLLFGRINHLLWVCQVGPANNSQKEKQGQITWTFRNTLDHLIRWRGFKDAAYVRHIPGDSSSPWLTAVGAGTLANWEGQRRSR